LLSACGDVFVVRGCEAEANTAANNSGIHAEVFDPYRCVYSIGERGNPVDLLVGFFAPSSWYVGKLTIHAMFAAHASGWVQLGEEAEVNWGQGPQCGAFAACIALIGGFSGATGDPDVNGLYTDQYRAAGMTPSGSGLFHINFKGTVGVLANVVGPSTPAAGYTYAWQADVNIDTLSYRYQWYVDASPVSGATNRSFLTVFLDESGTQHQITVVATLMDGTTQTKSQVATVQMNAIVSGPTWIDPGATGTWEASAYGARLPLASCQWWLDGTVISEGSCTLQHTFDTGPDNHVLSVYVTDARGVGASSSGLSIHVSGDPGCQPPNCYETLRAPRRDTLVRRKPVS
ncbi:MAG TPA: hypothetical protein VFT29_06565, partial [Gemmatimonadaceae bacterium]|nr:hypothetical protein [Gemmatimonadaceae bacterium]